MKDSILSFIVHKDPQSPLSVCVMNLSDMRCHLRFVRRRKRRLSQYIRQQFVPTVIHKKSEKKIHLQGEY